MVDRVPVVERSDERAILIGAAWTVLRRSGFDGFKVQLVLREAGVSARTFYRHFSDKDGLMLALVEDEYVATSRRLRRAVAEAPPEPDAQVAAWIRELLLAGADPARLARARLFSSYHPMMGRAPGALVQSNQVILEPLVEAIRAGQMSGLFHGDDPHGDAEQVARLAGGALNEHLASGGPSTGVEPLIGSTVRFALRALHSDPSSHPAQSVH
jgi:TetR/AcrR family transcriptional regulator